MLLHIIEGEQGCRYAAQHGAAAVIVDALRASATAAALFSCGAKEILATQTVADAVAVKKDRPEALLYGERGGVPPTGFDYGNSPTEAIYGKGRPIIFTTTTGAGRLFQAWGATPLLMGSTINAAFVVQYLLRCKIHEAVLVPAGLMNDPDFDAQEDWAAATYIAMMLCNSFDEGHTPVWGNGYDVYQSFRNRIEDTGLTHLFNTAPHANRLRAIGKEADILYCAQTNIYATLPLAIDKTAAYITLTDGCKT